LLILSRRVFRFSTAFSTPKLDLLSSAPFRQSLTEQRTSPRVGKTLASVPTELDEITPTRIRLRVSGQSLSSVHLSFLVSKLTSVSLNSSRSPYFASGVISARQVLAETARQSPGAKLPVDKKASATGTWVSEIAWREFYNHIIAAYPRVSMGQPFNVKYRGVQWETDPKYLQAWKEGKTASPLFLQGSSHLDNRRLLSSSNLSISGIPHRRRRYATVQRSRMDAQRESIAFSRRVDEY